MENLEPNLSSYIDEENVDSMVDSLETFMDYYQKMHDSERKNKELALNEGIEFINKIAPILVSDIVELKTIKALKVLINKKYPHPYIRDLTELICKLAHDKNLYWGLVRDMGSEIAEYRALNKTTEKEKDSE